MERPQVYKILAALIVVNLILFGIVQVANFFQANMWVDKSSCTFSRGKLLIVAGGTKRHPMTRKLCDSWEGVYKAGTGNNDVDN